MNPFERAAVPQPSEEESAAFRTFLREYPLNRPEHAAVESSLSGEISDIGAEVRRLEYALKLQREALLEKQSIQKAVHEIPKLFDNVDSFPILQARLNTLISAGITSIQIASEQYSLSFLSSTLEDIDAQSAEWVRTATIPDAAILDAYLVNEGISDARIGDASASGFRACVLRCIQHNATMTVERSSS